MLGVTQIIPSYQPSAGPWTRIHVANDNDDDNDEDNDHYINVLYFQLLGPSSTPVGLWCPKAASPIGVQPITTLGIV